MSENEDIEVNHIDGNIVLMTGFFVISINTGLMKLIWDGDHLTMILKTLIDIVWKSRCCILKNRKIKSRN